MTLQEAIKSGKPFSRPAYHPNKYFEVRGANIRLNDGVFYRDFVRLDVEDILAEDWEVKP